MSWNVLSLNHGNTQSMDADSKIEEIKENMYTV